MIHVAIRATADELLKEYKACESPDYISYVRQPQYFSLHHSVTHLRLFRDPTKANRPDDIDRRCLLCTVYVLHTH